MAKILFPGLGLPRAPATPSRVRTRPPSRVGHWLDDRLGLSALRYAVPAHATTLWYTLGGITVVGIVVLVISGIWLGQYYNPDPAAARDSVVFIQTQAPYGDIIRGIHIFAAYLVVLTSFLHLIRVFVTASYKVPREINWLVGVALFAILLLGSFYTGSVLRWDQESYEALAHNLALANLLGALGGFFSVGFTASVDILHRLYIAHISLVPMVFLLLLIGHIFLIKHHGISPTAAQAEAGLAPHGKLPPNLETEHYSSHLRLMIGYGLALLGLAGMLAVVFPQPVGPAADPSMEITKPAFIYYWLYAAEDWFGVRGIGVAAIAFFGILALVPIIDHTPARRIMHRPFMLVLGSVLLAAIVALSIFVALRPITQHLGM